MLISLVITRMYQEGHIDNSIEHVALLCIYSGIGSYDTNCKFATRWKKQQE